MPDLCARIMSQLTGVGRREFWYEFLQMYRSYPCLWNVKDPSYLQKDVKREAYQVLLAKVHEVDPTATLDVVKKKIDSFRTAFRREEKKVILSMNSGAMDDEIYTPTLWYYRELEEFLGNKTEEHRNLVIARASCNNEDEYRMVEERLDEAIVSEESEEEKYTPPPLKKRMKFTDARSDHQSSRIFAQSVPVPQTDFEDDCHTFAANLKVQMRELNKDQKYIAQKLISDVMFLARTNRLNFDSCVNSNLTYRTIYVPSKSDHLASPDLVQNKCESSDCSSSKIKPE
uniref:MADF domain-containing protein n=1 Tax=Heliothis virescens TaxID=7102 RepID=A0A2A4JIA5_HELVI